MSTYVITGITYHELPDNPTSVNFYNLTLPSPPFGAGPISSEELMYEVEQQYPIEYIRDDGTVFRCSMHSDVQKLLGVPYQVMEKLKSENKRLESQLSTVTQRADAWIQACAIKDREYEFLISCIRKANFWTRVKWLFTGIKIGKE